MHQSDQQTIAGMAGVSAASLSGQGQGKGGFVHDYVEQQFQTNSLIDVVLNVITYVSCIIYSQNT